jgi:hypothetical protein
MARIAAGGGSVPLSRNALALCHPASARTGPRGCPAFHVVRSIQDAGKDLSRDHHKWRRRAPFTDLPEFIKAGLIAAEKGHLHRLLYFFHKWFTDP